VELIAAVPTPFTASGELDLDAAVQTFRFAAQTPATLFVAGTTGEFPALDDDERLALFKIALDVAGPARTILHVGAADTRHATRLAAAAVSHGATRLAAITPYYLPASQEEVATHFAAVREAAGAARLYAYIFPERGAVSLPPIRLSRMGLAGVKLSGSAARRLGDYVQPGFEVYTGDDGGIVEAAAAGATGVVSGVSAVFPRPFADLIALLNSGEDPASARSRVAEAVALLGPSIGRLKYALAARGLAGPYARMTVDPPGPAQRAAIERLVAG
jgi:4-hydroxy-tetrahydrodipicolinate synthase